MGPPLVVVSSRSFGTGMLPLVERLTEAGCRVVRIDPHHDLALCRNQLAEASAWIAGVAPVTDEHLAAAPRLHVLARYGVGVDAVDLAAARRRGITVTNTPGANARAVAEHALALTLAALRSVVAGDHAVRSGRWTKPAARARELAALTVGIVGAGRIGRAYADLLRALGSEVLAHDPFAAARPELPLVDLPELLARCDVVSLHAPGGAPVVTAELLSTVRPGLVLINTARATLVDEVAVAAALRDGRVLAFAADTLVGEGTGDPSPLLDADLVTQVTATPHVAAQTVEAMDAMGLGAVEDVLAVLSGQPPTHPVEV